MIKKNWSLLLLAIVILIVSLNFISKKNDKIELTVKTFKTGAGWGYDVLTNDSVYIHQQYIPAIAGNKNFVDEKQAKTIGSLVIKKMKEKKLLSISINELDSCKINY